MVLADTSIWADHFRSPNPLMTDYMAGDRLLMHPFVVGELVMGHLPNRFAIVRSLREMDQVIRATDDEVLAVVEREKIQGLGVGWIDAHLLVSVLITPEAMLWTRDRRLNALAQRFGCAAQLHH